MKLFKHVDSHSQTLGFCVVERLGLRAYWEWAPHYISLLEKKEGYRGHISSTCLSFQKEVGQHQSLQSKSGYTIKVDKALYKFNSNINLNTVEMMHHYNITHYETFQTRGHSLITCYRLSLTKPSRNQDANSGKVKHRIELLLCT